ncbi:cytochrome c peroxidase [Flavobacterium arsenatis]|uniref:Cytochrome c peroxidase n=1 Tax=Flavobacterium arsenatis TaxID=1484332 RepID=A0ABU1TL32_9FLAO|nr:cytochrome c peroxidase [Flavobacterium arsenatis]MDR6966113.1 cytochrome c peroxidase [Flavobacterium arsenatis]
MKFKKAFRLLFLAPAVLFLHLQFSTKEVYLEDDFRRIIFKDVKELSKEIDLLHQTAYDFNRNQASLKQLQQQLKNTRNSYKKIEFVLEYYFPKHIKYYINGAPLNHLDPFPINENTPNYSGLSPKEYSKSLPLDHLNTDHYKDEQRVVEPVGLQVLDELIFSDEAISSGEAIQKHTFELQEWFRVLEKGMQRRTFFYDYEMMEASRIELVRIFTLGITGFDTPGSLNALEEANVSLKSLQKILHPIVVKASEKQRVELDILFKKTVAYLNKNKNFDAFDRLEFLTEFINPLYKKTLELQKELNIKSVAETTNRLASWNAYSDNIFDEDFINPYYYTLLKEEDDNEHLRELGKLLFYDQNLSKSQTMSCASCHKPELAFTDGEKKSLASIEGQHVLRNSPTLINAVFSDKYFYDLRAFDLEEQGEHVIESHLEFDTSFSELVQKLNGNTHYTQLFQTAFGKKEIITRYYFSLALSSYIVSLRSQNSPFDQFVQGKTNKVSAEVRRGFNLFMGKANCATCHFAPTFSGLVPPLYHESESEVLGVFESPNILKIDADLGRIANNKLEDREEIYRHSFKTPTVRNIKLTAPYFHNGAYPTLEEVLDFYNKGGAGGMGLSYELPNQTLSSEPLNLTKREIASLIAFMESLTDNPEKFRK